jgi:DNA-binding MarR family transcriptional regulator
VVDNLRHPSARLERQDSASVNELARPFAIKLPAVMKHPDVLDDAGLIARSPDRNGTALLRTHKGSHELAPALRALLVGQP